MSVRNVISKRLLPDLRKTTGAINELHESLRSLPGGILPTDLEGCAVLRQRLEEVRQWLHHLDKATAGLLKKFPSK